MPNYVKGHGPSNAQLMIIGEAPGVHEDQIGLTLVGPSGKDTDLYLKKAGLENGLEETYRTNVYKYRPPANNISRISEVCDPNKAIEELLAEIRAINPNCILALGSIALKALTGKTGISHYRGSLLLSITGHKVIPTIHPAAIYKEGGAFKYSARVYIMEDFKKAVRESKDKVANFPSRQLDIIRSASQLEAFLESHKDKREFATDIEAYKGIPTCISFAFNPTYGVSVPFINLKPSQSFPAISEFEFVKIYRLVARILEDPRSKIIGQNLKYDYEKLQRVLGIYPTPPFIDNSFLQHTLYPELPKKHEFLCSVYTNEPYYKFEGKEFNIKRDRVEQHYLYNAKDAVTELEVSIELRKHLREWCERYPWLEDYFYNFKMKLHQLYMDIESVGFKVDFDKVQELYDKYWKLSCEAREIIRSKSGVDVNTNSPKQVDHLLYDILGLPRRAGTGESVITMLLANHAKGDQIDVLNNLLYKRRYDKTISTYILAAPDTDGRIRTSYRICGTETGRTSTSNLKPPLRPFKGPGTAIQTWTKHGDIGEDVGHMYIADEGYEFVDLDLSQAEPRIVALLSEDYDLLERFDKIDIHKESAGVCFSLDEAEAQKMSKEDIRRFIGKTSKNAANYDVRKGTLARSINDDANKFHLNVKVSEKEAGEMLIRVHAKYPKVRAIFHEEVKKALIDNKGVLVNPYGGIRGFNERWGEELWRSALAHIPQSTVSEKIKRSALEAKRRKPGLFIVAEKHDALSLLSKIEERKENISMMKDIMEQPIDFGLCSLKRGKLVIPVGIEIGVRYNMFSKYKED